MDRRSCIMPSDTYLGFYGSITLSRRYYLISSCPSHDETTQTLSLLHSQISRPKKEYYSLMTDCSIMWETNEKPRSQTHLNSRDKTSRDISYTFDDVFLRTHTHTRTHEPKNLLFSLSRWRKHINIFILRRSCELESEASLNLLQPRDVCQNSASFLREIRWRARETVVVHPPYIPVSLSPADDATPQPASAVSISAVR